MAYCEEHFTQSIKQVILVLQAVCIYSPKQQPALRNLTNNDDPCLRVIVAGFNLSPFREVPFGICNVSGQLFAKNSYLT